MDIDEIFEDEAVMAVPSAGSEYNRKAPGHQDSKRASFVCDHPVGPPTARGTGGPAPISARPGLNEPHEP
jgi:hypothetical protein